MPTFLPGRELNRRFFEKAVRPVLDADVPGVPYAAAMLGPGSEVLGFDTAMSMDHDWGLRLLLLLGEPEAQHAESLARRLRRGLPTTFLGHAVRPVADGAGTEAEGQPMSPISASVRVLSLRQFVRGLLDIEPDQPLSAVVWLTLPAQLLCEITAGAVYQDDSGELSALRERLRWYPHEVWLYLLAAGWQRIGQEEHLMPRAGFVGAELGSAIIGSRLVRDIMQLCFLMERRYTPYPKWLGTAFKQLDCAPELEPILWRAQRAATWRSRQAACARAYVVLARRHNALALTEPLPDVAAAFHERPFRVIDGGTFAAAIAARITDPAVKRIAARGLFGGIDQVTDNTDVRGRGRRALRALYE